MSELSFDELQAETGELLPERETLGAIIIENVGGAQAEQAYTFLSVNKAVNIQPVNVAVASFNHVHAF
jgi:hypothetical protein